MPLSKRSIQLTAEKSVRYFILTALLLLSLLGNNTSAFQHESAFSRFVPIKIIGINDFHGAMSGSGRISEGLSSGARLAGELQEAKNKKNTIIALVGDQIGASPPASGLLNDEPTILFFNQFANSDCISFEHLHEKCNMVATVGNHELDHGINALLTLIKGSKMPFFRHWLKQSNYPGAVFPYISANIFYAKTLLFKPYVIKKIGDVKVAFIGAILKNANQTILPSMIKDITFTDEATAINHYIPELKAKKISIIVAIIHEGGTQASYQGQTKKCSLVSGRIVNIVKQLDDGIDIVMTGHTHSFLNAYLQNKHGKRMLVTQANSYGTHFTEVQLVYDRKVNRLVSQTARIINIYKQRPKPIKKNILKLINAAESKVKPLIRKKIVFVQNDLSKKVNRFGESMFGDLIADAYRTILNADIGIVNLGSIRADIPKGLMMLGDLYTALPFGNAIVKIELTGSNIYQLLEEQWRGVYPLMLQISGITYCYDLRRPIGHRIVSINYKHHLLQKDKSYTIATSNFLASGGDGFEVMRKAKLISIGPRDLDVVLNYIKQQPMPISGKYYNRIKQI